MIKKDYYKYLYSGIALLLIISVCACGSGGGGSSSGGTGSGSGGDSSSPVLLQVEPSHNSSIATDILESFQIDFQFRDKDGDLDEGFFCMDWGGYVQCYQLDTSFANIQEGFGQMIFSLFYTPPLIGNVTVEYWLTDKAGHESDRISFLFSQTKPQWPWQLGTELNDIGTDIIVDSLNDVFTIWDYNGSAHIAKYSSDASCQGILRLDSQPVKAIAADSSNNFYISSNVYTNLPETSTPSVSVSKYDSNGNQIWNKILASNKDDLAGDIAVDKSGNVYVTGRTNGDLDGNVNAGMGLGYDIFLAKYDSSGNNQWTRQIATLSSERGSGVAVDSGNNVYVVGGTGGDLSGQGATGNSDWNFLMKYDSSGNRLWIKQFGRLLNFETADIVIDSSDNIYVTGSNGSDLNLNAAVGFIRKFNAAGELQWVQMLGGQSWYAQCNAISLDQYGNIIVTGAAYGTVDSEIPTDNVDAFVAKYDSSGTRSWFTLFSSPHFDIGYSIAADLQNFIYVTGTTEGSLPGYTNAGRKDIFIAKFDPDGKLSD